MLTIPLVPFRLIQGTDGYSNLIYFVELLDIFRYQFTGEILGSRERVSFPNNKILKNYGEQITGKN